MKRNRRKGKRNNAKLFRSYDFHSANHGIETFGDFARHAKCFLWLSSVGLSEYQLIVVLPYCSSGISERILHL